MAEMLLINPRKRRRAAATRTKRKAVRRRRNPVSARAVVMAPRRRRRNPVAAYKRRRNPITARRRRRNPIGLGGGSSLMAMLKGAAIGGAGAVAVDVVMGQVGKFLPASMMKTPGKVGLYDVVKFGVTVLAGKALSRSTRGLSMKMAQGAAVVQAYQVMQQFVGKAGMPLGYYSPAGIIAQGNNRLNPIRPAAGLNAYTKPGVTPMLSRYTSPGASQLLNARARTPQGVAFR